MKRNFQGDGVRWVLGIPYTSPPVEEVLQDSSSICATDNISNHKYSPGDHFP